MLTAAENSYPFLDLMWTMSEPRARELDTQQRQMGQYIRTVAGSNGSSSVDDIARAKELLDRGALSQEEYDALKRRALV